MVGEIRDHETAEIAIHAALTGHLVFSTLHTNDAAGAVTRLLDMGVEPYLAASSLVGVVAHVLKNLGSVRAMVVHGLEGLDEISLCGPTKVAELRGGEVKEYTVEPEQFGFKACRLEELHGGNPDESAAIVRGVLESKKGPARDVVLLNSGAALYVSGSAGTIQDGIPLAAESIDSGKARRKLAELVEMTNAS
jgi:anthranilate phosphoribosyltransferase